MAIGLALPGSLHRDAGDRTRQSGKDSAREHMLQVPRQPVIQDVTRDGLADLILGQLHVWCHSPAMAVA